MKRLGFIGFLEDTFKDMNEEKLFEKRIEFLKYFGYGPEEAIEEMKIYGNNLVCFFEYYYPQCKVKEMLDFIREREFRFEVVFDEEKVYKSIIQAKGDKFLIFDKLFSDYSGFRKRLTS